MELSLVKENRVDPLLRKVWKEYSIPVIEAKRNWTKWQWWNNMKKVTPKLGHSY